jgi:penicillin-binding protein 1C
MPASMSAPDLRRPRPRLTRPLRGLLAGLALLCAQQALAIASFSEVKAGYRSSESILADRHGEPIDTLRATLILSEDKRFYRHSGIDWAAAASAAIGNLGSSRTRGASTITMQLAGLIDPALETHAGRSVLQKIDQAASALAIERHWSKDQILEAYLNLVDFRGEMVGIGALSSTLFEKLPSGLNARESAIAVALIRSPNAPADRVSQRACAILKEQQQGEMCQGLSDYTLGLLARRGMAPDITAANIAPHLAHHLLPGHLGQTLRSTIDASLQRVANQALRQQMAELQGRNVGDGAVVVLDNATGDVLAYVASSGDYSKASNVDNILAARQAGSTLKPFLYEMAIEKRLMTAASLIEDSPVDLKTQAGLYIPQDYDHSFKGLVSLRTALGSSLNVPAVRTIVLVTPDAFQERLQRLGFNLKQSGDYYGFSLALGSAEVNLLELTNAYRTLANRGASSAPRFLLSESDAPVRHQVLEAGPSFIVADILADRSARSTTFGLGNILETRYWSGVKTGTSKDMRDNWCVGFSEHYTVGVWVGNDSGQPMWDVSGVTGAAPIWHTVMDYLHSRDRFQSAERSNAPNGVVKTEVSFKRQIEPERQEYFLAGTETSEVEPAQHTSAASRMIAAPTDGTIVALDPDIPPNAQRLKIRSATAPGTSIHWRLDGKSLSDLAELDWPLWPGHHHLELLDAKHKVIDQINFEVRGATVKRQA